MAQENNTAREQTALEKLSQDALNQARRERKMIQDTCIADLAQCDTEIPEALDRVSMYVPPAVGLAIKQAALRHFACKHILQAHSLRT